MPFQGGRIQSTKYQPLDRIHFAVESTLVLDYKDVAVHDRNDLVLSDPKSIREALKVRSVQN